MLVWGLPDPAGSLATSASVKTGSYLLRSYIVCWCGVCLTLLASLATSPSVKPVLIC